MLLIVEDDYSMQNSYRDLLDFRNLSEGENYVFARSHDEALECWNDALQKKMPITMIITDHRLIGKLTGEDVVKTIRSQCAVVGDVQIVRCSSFREGDYPNDVPYFSKMDLRRAIAALDLH